MGGEDPKFVAIIVSARPAWDTNRDLTKLKTGQELKQNYHELEAGLQCETLSQTKQQQKN